MEIKLKLGDLLSINQTLCLIIDDVQTTDFILKFKLLGIMKAFEPFVSNFEVIKNEKIIEYGKETEKGSFKISNGDRQAIENFNRDLEKLVNNEVSVNADKLKANEIFDKGIKAEHLIRLYSIIENQK